MPNLPPWAEISLLAAATLVGAALVATGLRWGVTALGDRWLKRNGWLKVAPDVRAHFAPSLFLTFFSLFVLLALPLLTLPKGVAEVAHHATRVVLFFAVTWFLVRLVSFAELALYSFYDVSVEDNYRQRRARTQIQYVAKILMVTVGVVGLGAMLLTFQEARNVGASLLASAGVASVVIGFAAQKSLANLVAGFQIAFTQPIRIDDVVIVEKEWGRIEEITLSYVVVRLWDLRRLVVPITYFVEKPFENWTRRSADILGTVFWYVDYRADVAAIRAEFERIVRAEKLWNRQTVILQVTECDAHTMQLRGLVSARNASEAFDLRCEVREKLLAWMQKNHTIALPVTRAEVTSPKPLSADPFPPTPGRG